MKKGRGRKHLDGRDKKEIILKLEEAWSLGSSDGESAAHADITPTQLCRWLQKDEKLRRRKEQLKEHLLLKVRYEIVNGIKGNPEFALKVAEKLIKDYQSKVSAGDTMIINLHEYILKLLEDVRDDKPKQIKAIEVADENKT